MISIGIDIDHGLVYEGNGFHGRGLWPTPVITPACFFYLSDGEPKAHPSSDRHGYRFREDSFDPISRIRRGRFYRSDQQQPLQWPRCTHHPGFLLDAIDPQVHAKGKSLETFREWKIWPEHIHGKRELPLVLLGMDDRFSSWSIISVEANATGEDFVTLKARSSFGVLPRIFTEKIPEEFQAKLNETLETFVNEVHRASPVSVIDRARDAATYALLAYYDLRGETVKDLGALAKKLEEDKKEIAANAAKIIARLHARAKPTEQERRDLHPIREQDAELAAQCVGALLCEISYAAWV